jgi:hypothetical protein
MIPRAREAESISLRLIMIRSPSAVSMVSSSSVSFALCILHLLRPFQTKTSHCQKHLDHFRLPPIVHRSRLHVVRDCCGRISGNSDFRVVSTTSTSSTKAKAGIMILTLLSESRKWMPCWFYRRCSRSGELTITQMQGPAPLP